MRVGAATTPSSTATKGPWAGLVDLGGPGPAGAGPAAARARPRGAAEAGGGSGGHGGPGPAVAKPAAGGGPGPLRIVGQLRARLRAAVTRGSAARVGAGAMARRAMRPRAALPRAALRALGGVGGRPRLRRVAFLGFARRQRSTQSTMVSTA